MNLDELVKEIRGYIDILNVKKIGEMNGDELSKLVVRLASYNSSLGEFVASSERDADLAEAYYEITREKAYKHARTQDNGVGDAENIKKIASENEKVAYLEAKYQYKVLSILRQDVNNLIDAIRSRLSWLKTDKEQSIVQA